jgi:serralysin
VATYQFSALSDGQAIAFSPDADVLSFDQAGISAAHIRVGASGSSSVVTYFAAGKDLTLIDVSPLQLATSNAIFANGSRLLFGDDSASTATDNDANTLRGTAGDDLLAGFGGNDALGGGSGGADWLEGGLGLDRLAGGSGRDSFVFREAGSANADLITDFSTGWDNIQLDVGTLTGLGEYGRFVAGDERFAANSTGAAQDASDRIIFNTNTLQVIYDPDGLGSAAGQLLFTITAGRTVSATDFWVIGTAPAQGIDGGPGDDPLEGTPGDDTLNGFGGNDTLNGLGGNDLLVGGDGDDVLRDYNNEFEDAPGSDTLDGGLGNDVYDLRSDPFQDHSPVLVDAGGIDTVLANHDFVLPDGFENLTLYEGFRGTGNSLDNLISTATNEPHFYEVDGADGNDSLIGGDDPDTFRFVAGSGSYGNDTATGGGSYDTLSFLGARSAVVIDMRAGTATGGGTSGTGSVTFSGIERAEGSPFDDHITAHDGMVTSEGGMDFFGGASVRAGDGDDTVIGGAANDFLDGGAGSDSFVFEVPPGSGNADVIADFASGADTIELDATVHPNIGASGRFTEDDARFWPSATGSAHDGDDRVVYNTSTGELWHDADGSGAGAGELVATLSGSPSVAATDILVI